MLVKLSIIMLVHSPATVAQDTSNVVLDNSALENVQSYKYLGVVVDNRLNFDEFIENKYNKINYRIFQLKRVRP